jgi:hypothetical protein
LTDPVYMQMPQGWTINDQGQLVQHPDTTYHDKSHFLHLRRNLYSYKQAAHNGFKHLTQGLLRELFCQSAVDPCLFLCNDCLLILYMDDCIIFSKQDKTINTLLRNLLKTKDQFTTIWGFKSLKTPLTRASI